jgi:hypothetical protein
LPAAEVFSTKSTVRGKKSLLHEVHGEGEEVDAGARVRVGGGDQHHGLAVGDERRAGGLLGHAAGLDGEGASVDLDGLGVRFEPIGHESSLPRTHDARVLWERWGRSLGWKGAVGC